MKTKMQTSVEFFRWVSVATFGVLFLNVTYTDAVIAKLWQYIVSKWWFRHDSFEPALSTACFIVYLPLWMFFDKLYLSGYLQRMTKYKIEKSDSTSRGKSWMVEGHFVQQLLVYVVPIFTIDFFYPRRDVRLDNAVIPTTKIVAQEVFLSLLLYDLFFTITHYSVHQIPLLYSKIHSVHHDQTSVSARDTIRLSVVEEVIDVLCSVAALNCLSAHPLSRAIYDIVIVYLLCELHSGWSFPFQLEQLVPFNLWGGPVRHAKHHSDAAVCYQKFFTYIDDHILGTGIQKLV
eukprot:TRINITY_DN13687_c2_g1_i2.p1 TRINITY_DN13687_c2_g1~~TRINITY_DN13687_c2_g1_i2.p1  ORF type:complete len:289 (+),score=21.82 TRINITY_DN13687_c2_g1_i2:54-920(+)